MTELLEIFDGRTVAIVGNGEERDALDVDTPQDLIKAKEGVEHA